MDRRINNCPVLVCDHHAVRDGYFEIATVIDSPILSALSTAAPLRFTLRRAKRQAGKDFPAKILFLREAARFRAFVAIRGDAVFSLCSAS